MSRRLGPRSPRSPLASGTVAPENEAASVVFNQFCLANTFQSIMSTFNQLCDLLELKPSDHTVFYRQLKSRLTSWKAKSLWAKLDKRSSHREYKKGTAATGCRVLIIGSGPCGLRMAIEIVLLGGKAVVVEKRESFSRNNVLHLWPYLIHDLKAFGAKKFFGKFCAGSIDHISIRTLQCILLKVALLLGVEVHPGVAFVSLVEPDITGTEKCAWRAKVLPADHPVSEYEFDVLVGSDGKRNTLGGFKRKEFRGKLAIAITANFINRNTTAEASVEEISGVAFIFNQKFFKDLNDKTGIDLENIVYYKDETHYFVMTAKKKSLLDKNVLIRDYEEPLKLLARENVNQEALMNYAKEAADVSTNHMLPNLDFAHNGYGQPDVAMFDFTSMFAAEHASRVVERHGHKLLITLVGDSLLEPFWPTGSGCARGFLGVLDTAWMVRSWASGHMTPLEVMAERESVYQLLSQTTPENLNKNFAQYTIDPNTRYRKLNATFFKPFQVQHQYDGMDKAYLEQIVQLSQQSSRRYEYIRDSHLLLKWFQRQLENYRSIVQVTDLTTSWRNGLSLCALIHKYRPELVDVFKLDPNQVANNNQKAFDIAEKELGIQPLMSGQDMAQCEVPDKLTMVSYLSQFYEYFRKESVRPAKMAKTPPENVVIKVKQPSSRSPSSKLALLNKISQRIRQRRPSTSGSEDGLDKENDGMKRRSKLGYGTSHKKMREDIADPDPSSAFLLNYRKLEEPLGGMTRLEQTKKLIKESQVNAAVGVRGQNKVSMLAKDLARQFSGEPTPEEKEEQKRKKAMIIGQIANADSCFFCNEKVYLVERHTAEGVFFHRGCFRCHYCGSSLRLGAYAFQRTEEGEGRFYCFQHAGLEAKPRSRPRKRSFEDKDLVEKLMPIINASKPAQISPRGKLLSPPQSQVDGTQPLKRTPERIEYDIESEQEESELDQTTHNLNASYMSEDADSSDSDSSSEDLVWSDDEEDFSDPNSNWTAIARNYSKKIKREYRKKSGGTCRHGGEDASDSDTPTIGASDADAESDTETEDYEDVNKHGKHNLPRLSSSAPADPWAEKMNMMKSPTTQETKSKRLSFFDTVAEPVRLDPWSFQGLRKKEESLKSPERSIKEEAEVQKEDNEKADEQKTSPVESAIPDINVLDEDAVIAHLPDAWSSSEEENVLQESVHAEYMRVLQHGMNGGHAVDEETFRAMEQDLALGAAGQAMIQDDIGESDSLHSSDEDEMSTSELARRRDERLRRMNRTDEVTAMSAGVHHDRISLCLLDVSSEDVSQVTASPDQDPKENMLEEGVDVFQDMDVHPDRYYDPTQLPSAQTSKNSHNKLSQTQDVKDFNQHEGKMFVDKGIRDKSEFERTTHRSESVDSTSQMKSCSDISKHRQDQLRDYSRSISTPSLESNAQKSLKDTPNKPSESHEKSSSQTVLSPSVPTTPLRRSPLEERGPPKPNEEIVKNKRSFFTAPSEPVRIDAKSFLGMQKPSSTGVTRDFSGSDRTLGKSSETSSQSEISSEKKVLEPDVEFESEADVKEYVKSYFRCHELLQQEVHSQEVMDSEVSVSESDVTLSGLLPNNDEVKKNIHSPDDTSLRSELDTTSLDTTSALVQENLLVLENSPCDNFDDLSDIVSDNLGIKTTSPDSRPVHQPSPPRPNVLELYTTHNINKTQSPNEAYAELNSNHAKELAAFGVKSPTSSEESDSTKFDTIKRRKVSAPSNAISQKPSDKAIGKNKMDDLQSEKIKPTETVAPLAHIEFESDDLLSDVDVELVDNMPENEIRALSPDTAGLIQHAQALVKESEENAERIKTDAILLRQQISDSTGDKSEKRKSDVERDAIRRIDEMLESFEQSKETKIDDLPVGSNRIEGNDAAISRWLEDDRKSTSHVRSNFSISSPILAGHTDIKKDKPKREMNPSLESPSLAEISCISEKVQLKGDQSVKSPILAGHSDITLDHSTKTNDSSSLPFVSFVNTTKDESSQYESFGTPNQAFMGSPEARLKSIVESPPCNALSPVRKIPPSSDSPGDVEAAKQDSSITEYTVSDNEDGNNRSYKVDEKYVNIDRRRRKKSGKSNGSDSSFTISTPSGSIDSTSSIADLNSTRASSAVTPSTTGDSFSAVRGTTPGNDGSSYSLDKMARANIACGQDSPSLSLERVLEENLQDNTGSSDLSSIGAENVKLTTKLRSDLEKSLTGNTRSQTSPKQRSVSAPTSVQPKKKFPLSVSALPPTSETLNIGGSLGSSRDSTIVNSADTSKNEDSFYYTPNVSNVESMDTSDTSYVTEPKSPGGRTTKSDSFLDDVKTARRERMSTDTPSESLSSSGQSLMNAKRRFFMEAATPVRLDAKQMFGESSKKAAPTAAVPKSNVVVGSKDLFYTPVSRSQSEDSREPEEFKHPADVRPRVIPDNISSIRAKDNQSVARELSTEEKKVLWEESHEQQRSQARERARMLSDEELGIVDTPRKESLKKKDIMRPKDIEKLGNKATRPQSARLYSTQSSEEGSTKGMPVKRSASSAVSKEKDKKGGKRLFGPTQKSPKAERRQLKSKRDDEEKENKVLRDISVEKKDKRKSLLSMFRTSKSQEKKEKEKPAKDVVSPMTNGEHSPKLVRKETEKEKKVSGVIFRSKKAQAKVLEKQKAEEESKRRSLLSELVTPMYEQVVGGPNQRTSAVKAKIETVAPTPAKAPFTVLEPPKATASDFDTESEWDTQSVRSLQSSQVNSLTEEELSKMLRKQQKAAKRRQREQETRRLHMAQEIQRQLEEVEVKQRGIEERGVSIERALRGEGPDAHKDEAELMQEWFNLVHEKNVLVRYESELMVHARELELEDRHSRLEQQLRDRMSLSGDERAGSTSSAGGAADEDKILQELVDVVEQRDALVALLEEDRQREREQERGLREIMSSKGYELSPISYANRMRLPSLGGDVTSDC